MRLHLNQPVLNKKVLEYSFDNRFTKWYVKKLGFILTGTTIALPFITIIFYCLGDGYSDLQFKGVRVHEFEHAFQSESNWFTWWCKYIWDFIKGLYHYRSWSEAYYNIPYEVDAYNLENEIVMGKITLPDWVK